MYHVIIKFSANSGDEYFILATEDPMGSIRAWLRKREAVGYFERGYNQAHKRGYQMSASATLNWMQFSPSIVRVASLEAVKEYLAFDADGSLPLKRYSGVAGSMLGLPCNNKAAALWEAGAKPELIKMRKAKVTIGEDH